MLNTRKSEILANVVWSTFGFIVLTTMLMSWALLFPFVVVDKMFTDVKLLQQPHIYFISIFEFTVKTFFQDGFQHISAQNHGSWRMTSFSLHMAYIILSTYVYIYIYYFHVSIYIYCEINTADSECTSSLFHLRSKEKGLQLIILLQLGGSVSP